LLYKGNWDEAKKVFEEWWSRNLDRPLIQVTYPKAGQTVEIDAWAFLRCYPEIDKALDRLFSQFSNTVFEKEAYPNVWVNLGPGSLAAYLGAELKFDGRVNTAWFMGNFSLDELSAGEFDLSNRWWKYTCRAYEAATKRCWNKAVVAFTDLLDAVTVTAQLRGDFPTNLVKDMFTEGNKLKRALARVHELLFRYYEESCGLINVSENGYSTWAGLWSKEKYFTLQCDAIVYLSPKMFRRFVLPLVEEECTYFNRTMWHLDGPLSLKHLDDLLNIPELDCIQWIPGEGNPDSGEDCWMPLYNKIMSKGKLLQIYVPPSKVMHVLRRIPRKGVALNVTCRTSLEAERILSQIEREYF